MALPVLLLLNLYADAGLHQGGASWRWTCSRLDVYEYHQQPLVLYISGSCTGTYVESGVLYNSCCCQASHTTAPRYDRSNPRHHHHHHHNIIRTGYVNLLQEVTGIAPNPHQRLSQC